MASKDVGGASELDSKSNVNYVRNRAVCKRKVTQMLNFITDKLEKNELNKVNFESQKALIKTTLAEIKEFDDLFNNYKFELKCSDEDMLKEIDSQTAYHCQVISTISSIENTLNDVNNVTVNSSVNASVREPMNVSLSDVRPPVLQCSNFSGEEEDKFAFSNFLTQFKNIIDCKVHLSKSAKLSYLIGYLRGYALCIIKHLAISDDNYDIAVTLLIEEFLDKPFLIDEGLKKVLNISPKFDVTYKQTRVYINEVRTLLHELNNLGCDLLATDSAGCQLVSHIVFSKLPPLVRKELAAKVDNTYPTIGDIFENFNSVLKGIVRNSNVKPNTTPKLFNKTPSKQSGNFSVATLQNYRTENKPDHKTGVDNKQCKFCNLIGHTISYCSKYLSLNSRRTRCEELGLCDLCTSSKHRSDQCVAMRGGLPFACRNCKKKTHVDAMCPEKKVPISSTNVCINHSREDGKPYLLPTISLNVSKNGAPFKVRFLIDPGSQRSYINARVLGEQSCILNGKKIPFIINTYNSSETKHFNETLLDVNLFGRNLTLPVLVDSNFNLEFTVCDIDIALHNLQREGYALADSAFDLGSNNNYIKLDALMGVDLLQYLPNFSKIDCMNGAAFLICGTVVPFGTIENFLYPHQIKPVEYYSNINTFKENGEIDETLINFVLEPESKFLDPVSPVLSLTSVEQGLENMFSLESLGIDETLSHSNYDEFKISEFNSNLEFIDGKYHVKLPWIENKIDLVPSNHKLALAVLNRVERSLNYQNLIDQYQAVFDQQLEDGIIERIFVDPSDYDKHVWIPHRPVVKFSQQTTTKVRPVFNCSLKIGDYPSLNESAYAGIDLLTNLTSLLFKFRSNNYVLIGDIKQAFLQIKLKDDFDRNKFSFFWRKNGELMMYRYSTLVFGFCTSPFALNYVIKQHVAKYPDDRCTKALLENFYVDNLIISGNQLNELAGIHDNACERMSEGGFSLRSWNSNSDYLIKIFKSRDIYVSHGCPTEKVLGYEYNPSSDKISLSNIAPDTDARTKRDILSEVSKIFDPLGLILPVTIRGRLLIRELWINKFNWDEILPASFCNSWSKLSSDLKGANDISFPRKTLNTDEKSSLCIFTDASKSSYGFAAYAVGKENSELIFAKCKVAPNKPRSVPTLELLGVFLALKCLEFILSSCVNSFKKVFVAIDAQIVLSWVLSNNVKTKNMFVKNRIKDIKVICENIRSVFDIEINFKYVKTNENPADLLTRGLSVSQFKEQVEFWIHGPSWLKGQIVWPVNDMLCLSNESRAQVCAATLNAVPSIINFNRFSSVHKLFKTVFFVFKFINNCRKRIADNIEHAKVFCLKEMQREIFHEEINYLKTVRINSNTKTVPDLVSKLNLFLDDKELLRSRGRTPLNYTLDEKILNPVLIAKKHPLTTLIVEDSHKRCKHLGLQTTVNFIRSHGYWIPSARQSVKNIIANCILCQKFNNFAFKYPKMTSMPEHKMKFVKPFLHVGVDYTGHLWVHCNDKNSQIKMYIVIYTCMNIRAIHLDLLPDMSTKSFLLSFTRFCNLYGIPSHLYSDNAKSFVAGGTILKESLNSTLFCNYFERNNIKHVTIPLYSAWVGASWERMIRVVKSALYKTIGRVKLSYFELLTVLSDVQNAINSRPLTYRSSDVDLEVITPNSFLKYHDNANLIFNTEDVWKSEPDSDTLNFTLDKRNEAFLHFRNLWHTSYLLSLREHYRDLYDVAWENRVKPNDVVLVKLPNKPRPFWLMGRVLSLVAGHDNKIRSVKLKRGDGKTCHHSINHLYPLELNLTHNSSTENGKISISSQVLPDCAQRLKSRPVRQAAIVCKNNLRKMSF